MREFLRARSKLGLALAVLDFGFGLLLVLAERYSEGSGGFISLRGLTSLLGTLPSSALVAKFLPSLGTEQASFYDTPYAWKTIAILALLMAANLVLFYWLGAGLGKFWRHFARNGRAASRP